MAQTMPVNFAIPNEGIIASYDFTEFATNIGVVNFYPATTQTSAGTACQLISNQDYSKNATVGLWGDSSPNYVDFVSVPLTKTVTFEGEARIYMRWDFTRSGQLGSGTGTVIIKIFKDTTEIASVITPSSPSTANGSTSQITDVLDVTIPKTTLNPGQTLTLRIGCNFTYDYHKIDVYTDPLDSADFTKLSLPVRIDL